jgi:ERCC4-type nuclease
MLNRNNRPTISIQRTKMADKAVSLRVKKVRTCSPATKSPLLAELVRDYEKATEQYGVIVRDLRGAMEVLKKPECQLLLEFAEIEKKHCERLHREIQDRLATDRRGA